MSQRWRSYLLAVILGASLVLGFAPASRSQSLSSYALGLAAPFNQLDHYPLDRNLAPPPDYRPTGDWVGRLQLPSVEELAAVETLSPIPDWAWLELWHAPADADLSVGQRLRVEWTDSAWLRDYVQAVSVDLRLSAAARRSEEQGNVIPSRLDGRDRVGPLQSLAGARPQDDVIVQLDEVEFVGSDGETTVVQIGREPLQVPDRFVGLVDIRAAVGPDTWPDPAERFRVRHYNPDSGQFDGRREVIRIPQQPRDRRGRYPSTPHDLPNSPAGAEGWYIYGANDREGTFTARALIPRQAVRLAPEETVTGTLPSIRYVQQQNWRQEPQRKGTVQTVAVAPQATTTRTMRQTWQDGDRALVVHLFGGIGGERGEAHVGGTVTGHFAYGSAAIARDPFTDELQWQVEYWQVYAHNTNGIVAGRVAWSDYMGQLQRGWLGTRPVSDMLVQFAPLTTDYSFGRTDLSPFDELMHQLQIMTARYRTGDGTGYAAVTPATSCVQDSSQALYIAIARLQRQLDRNPVLQSWLREHPNAPEVRRFARLGQLRDDILALLEPRGQVRPDWQQNAEYLAGASGRTGFVTDSSLANALLSWRSLLPRRAHDEVARVLLENGATLWFIRPNQVGGRDPTILPVAPTALFGQYPLLPALANRLALASRSVTLRMLAIALAGLAIYGAIALPLGFWSRCLVWQPVRQPPHHWLRTLVLLFATPALLEELCFRVWLLPPPAAILLGWRWALWALVCLALFVAYHPLQARTLYRRGAPTFYQLEFLGLTAGLGLTCTLVYLLTGSLWAIVLLHWLVTSVWILLLGGAARLDAPPQAAASAPIDLQAWKQQRDRLEP